MSNTVGMIFKIVLTFLLLAVFMSTYFFTTSYSQAIGFKTYIGDQIKREGGLTPTAMANIEDYAEKQYNSKFVVESLDGNDKKPYGEEVRYEIKGAIGGDFFNLPAVLINVSGSGISMVR